MGLKFPKKARIPSELSDFISNALSYLLRLVSFNKQNPTDQPTNQLNKQTNKLAKQPIAHHVCLEAVKKKKMSHGEKFQNSYVITYESPNFVTHAVPWHNT